jgi:UDP-N-acetylmuramoyl-L-alanyl-D-glutamate--2,6-diaminopimelate ligase
MKLSDLLAALPDARAAGPTDVEIVHLTADSRQARPGSLFVAYRGVSVDGHRFIPGAVEQGAIAVVGEAPPGDLPALPATYVQVADGRLALARLAAAWHGYPSRRLKVIGVTGTDGKTTTSTLIHSILLAAGHPSGLVSTVSARIGGQELDTGFHTTTPDALELQKYLACMVDAGMEYAVLETTSHGLEQQRAAAVDYDVAVLTNITHEHLDQHGAFESYRQAKAQLFRYLAGAARKPGVDKVSILNADDPSYPLLLPIPADVHLSYGLDSPADVTARDVAINATETRFTVITPAGEFPVSSCLLGRFNVYNLLAAIAVAVSQGLPAAAIQQGIAAILGVVGRMESITLPGGPPGRPTSLPAVIVDFAHTPNALESALRFARTLTSSRLIAVFGCAGLRDRGKRPLMGEVAGRLADLTIITAEDPRTENLDEIMEQIAGGCRSAGRGEGEGYILEGNREKAIARAVALAAPTDLVMVCGKGHERSMCYGVTEKPWSDQDAVRKALAGL